MVKEEKIKQLIKDYLRQAKMMQLATSADNQPWVCNVWFAADEDLNIYWFSSETRRHSKEVMNHQKVAAAIVLHQTPKDKPRGIQLQGIAELLTKQEDIDKAISVYKNRIFSEEEIQDFMQDTEKPHKFYKVTPTQFILFDLVNFPDNPRQELNL